MFKRIFIVTMIVLLLSVPMIANAAPVLQKKRPPQQQHILTVTVSADLVKDMPSAEIYDANGAYMGYLGFASVTESVSLRKGYYSVVLSAGCNGVYRTTTYSVYVNGQTYLSLSVCN